jgi:uncharacterized protein DUF6298
MRILRFATVLIVAALAVEPALAAGPLRVHSGNPRYFTNDSGQTIYLAGSHTWLNIQDGDTAFDFDAYLDFLSEYNHNFTRLWTWESSLWVLPDSRALRLAPLPWARTGPGEASDGGAKFDVTKFDEKYFDRLSDRVAAARKRGLYVSVMLFQGFSVSRKSRRRKTSPWLGHPFHRANNINGLDPDNDGDGEGYEFHTLSNRAVTRLQEAYVRKVVDAVNEFDNVIYEISNESHGASTEWQYHLIRYIREYEAGKPTEHLVWMSYQWDGIEGPGEDRALFDGPAEVVSPRGGTNEPMYRSDPPLADGSRIVVADTDHLWGIGGDQAWVWKSFLRGLHPIFMDSYRGSPHWNETALDPRWEPVRRAMGDTVRFAGKVDLASMTPSDDPADCSTRYCMREPGVAYLVYQPGAGRFDLRVAAGRYRAEWFSASTGETLVQKATHFEDGVHTLEPPFAGDAVLLLTPAGAGE